MDIKWEKTSKQIRRTFKHPTAAGREPNCGVAMVTNLSISISVLLFLFTSMSNTAWLKRRMEL